MTNASSHSPSTAAAQAQGHRYCDHPDCMQSGLHKAPKSRETLRDYFWFCLDHVREYNAAWNYCAGMTVEQVDAAIRNDVVWGRPTWPLGMIRPGGAAPDFRDPFGGFEEAAAREARRGRARREGRRDAAAAAHGSELYYCRLLQLKQPVTLTALKARYKELVKRLHPDVNGGDKDAEERLKEINEAYSALKKNAV